MFQFVKGMAAGIPNQDHSLKLLKVKLIYTSTSHDLTVHKINALNWYRNYSIN